MLSLQAAQIDRVRADPRYRELLKQLGIPARPRSNASR
jgi:hypothetical protein